MTKRTVFAALVLGLVTAAYLTWVPARGAASPSPSTVDLGALPAARVSVDARRGELIIELPPVDLPAASPDGATHHEGEQPPVSIAVLPTAGAVFGFRAEVVDAAGRALPSELIHHFNLLDPTHRELFLPIARRLAAAGKETGVVRIPWLLFGTPFERGTRVVASAMLHNPTPVSYPGARVRLVLNYTPDKRPWPLFRASPWQLDVAFPVGDKSFDLPPGRSERAYEGRPAVPGEVVAIGGHVHEYGVAIELWDATTEELIWRGEPVRDANDRVVAVPIGKLYGLTRLGARIVPEHSYRVRVVYDNPTGHVVKEGGMGVVGGLFIPDRGVPWPGVDPTDSLYQQDLRHYLGWKDSREKPHHH